MCEGESSDDSDHADHVDFCRVVPINLPTPEFDDDYKNHCNVQESMFQCTRQLEVYNGLRAFITET